MDGPQRPIHTALVVGVHLGLGVIRCLNPAVHRRINPFHGQIGPLYEPHFDLTTTGIVPG